MKRVASIHDLHALALRAGAEVVAPGGARFNSTRAKVTTPAPRPPASAPAEAPDTAALIAEMAKAITQAIRAGGKPPAPAPDRAFAGTAVPPAPRQEPSPAPPPVPVVMPAPTVEPVVTAGELSIRRNAAGTISGCTVALPNGRSVAMKIQHRYGLLVGATVDLGGSHLQFTVHRHPMSQRAETISFTRKSGAPPLSHAA